MRKSESGSAAWCLKFAVLLSAACVETGGAAQAQAAEQAVKTYRISAGDLGTALNAFSDQSGLQVLFDAALVEGLKAPAVQGQFISNDVLTRLLKGTGLEPSYLNERAVIVRKAAAVPKAAPSTKKPESESAPQQEEPAKLENVVVTGTRIKGAQPSSPVVMITQDDMRLAGQNNLGDVIRALPQNFSGGQNPGVAIGAGGDTANQNVSGGSALNLRGLGPDATLTLLNGARLPYDGSQQVTDITAIPVAAIERMEVLLDGASAIYGSDAVGGVANIVLKRDYDGAEVTARTGRATDGGYGQTEVSMVGGETWASGGLLVTGETSSTGNVLANQRDYLSYIPNPDLLSIYPKLSQDSVLISGHQELGLSAEVTLDAFHTRRSMTSGYLSTSTYYVNGADSNISGLSPSLRVTLPGDWSMQLHGMVGEDEDQLSSIYRLISTGAQTSQVRNQLHNHVNAADVEFEGALFAAPGGDARASVGGGWRETRFEQANLITGFVTFPKASDANRYAYAEINLPLVDESKAIPLVNRLALDGAIRYENYNSFGDTTTPKIGAIWKVSSSLDVKASWGKSFKAPTLSQQYQQISVGLLPASALGLTGVPSTATALIVQGGNPNLNPERADVVTAGLVIRPSFVPESSIELGWFDIDYTQRVTLPFPIGTQYGQALADPAYASYLISNPTASQQQQFIQGAGNFVNQSGRPYDPASVVAVFDNQNINAASQVVRGIDLDIRYATSMLDGLLSLSAGGSWITDAHRVLVDPTHPVATAGVVAYPAKYKGRMGANWSRSALTFAATINQVGGVWNTRTTPNVKGDSMTTLDLVADYAADVGQLKGLGFNVSVLNVFNQRPPFLMPIQPYYVNYDSTNYSALGRVVSVAITKRF
ncbi:MAG: TonB-dependent receptor [Rudaea sp.]|uniref:TonB-dependent receptor domain-containing protein n=1 Tax=Rudaea sp. TaxID=2136325 RepID=UPI0039E6562E